jgi:deoxyhypusine synthase
VNVKALLQGTKQYKDPESRQEAIHRIKAVLQPKSETQKAIDHIRAVLEKNRHNK